MTAKNEFQESHNGLKYRVATLADADAIAQLCLTDFYPRMPLFKHIGATEMSDVETTLAMLPIVLSQSASVLAVESGGGQQLVGARLSTIEVSSTSRFGEALKHPLLVDPTLATRYAKHSAVVRLVDRVESLVDWATVYPEATRALAFRLLVVKATHGRRGIGQTLVECSLRLANQLGIPLAVGSTESRLSQRIYEKLGFQQLAAVDYRDYIDDVTGERPFAGLAVTTEHTEAVMFAKRIKSA